MQHNPNLLADYLRIVSEFDARAEKLFNLTFTPRNYWGRFDVYLQRDDKVSVEAHIYECQNDWNYTLTCDPVLFACSDEELAETYAAHPPAREVR